MKRPITATPEFLQTPEGQALIRAMVKSYLEGPCKRPDVLLDDKEKFFAKLVEVYLDHLNHHVEPDLFPEERAKFEAALQRIYEERYRLLYPDDPAEERLFREQLLDITPWLAILTYEVWLEVSKRQPGIGRPTVDHLDWAREAFGWWRAWVNRLPYKMKLKRPCKCGEYGQAILDALDDDERRQLESLADTRPVEVEEGCPLC